MIEFGGIIYYFDMDALDKAVTPKNSKPNEKVSVTELKEVTNEEGTLIGTEKIVTTSLRGKEVDGVKYEILRYMIETLIDNDDEQDTSLGSERALDKTPLSYKMAFNTLHHYGILKEKE